MVHNQPSLLLACRGCPKIQWLKELMGLWTDLCWCRKVQSLKWHRKGEAATSHATGANVDRPTDSGRLGERLLLSCTETTCCSVFPIHKHRASWTSPYMARTGPREGIPRQSDKSGPGLLSHCLSPLLLCVAMGTLQGTSARSPHQHGIMHPPLPSPAEMSTSVPMAASSVFLHTLNSFIPYGRVV